MALFCNASPINFKVFDLIVKLANEKLGDEDGCFEMFNPSLLSADYNFSQESEKCLKDLKKMHKKFQIYENNWVQCNTFISNICENIFLPMIKSYDTNHNDGSLILSDIRILKHSNNGFFILPHIDQLYVGSDIFVIYLGNNQNNKDDYYRMFIGNNEITIKPSDLYQLSGIDRFIHKHGEIKNNKLNFVPLIRYKIILSCYRVK